MITSSHVIIYADDAAAARVFFRDVLGLPHVDARDGWLIFKDGIYGWWTREGGLADSDFSRVFHLRTDVVKRLTDQGLAWRRHPQSVPCYVRRQAE